MKKLLTATTLVAGLGAAAVGLDHGNEAHAAETTNESGSSIADGNLYTEGQCTWYVYNRVGGKISTLWGNANNWDTAASAAGYKVNHTPSEGSILQTDSGPYGHVAYVEDVTSSGAVKISEMNYSGGPFVKSTRTISSSSADSYTYIHV
ncbi:MULTISPECIES: CHAP domain-containing protein [Staphylococcus]|uniref:CHAP domain-containing protein n=1 Tax=Staphylococcus hsinchuensis TaxID=3051183 RepID=A0ABZ3EED0_9STAP|nr:MULTISPECIES: CHAP domain-containing protein [unclassified Staphylococcus]